MLFHYMLPIEGYKLTSGTVHHQHCVCCYGRCGVSSALAMQVHFELVQCKFTIICVTVCKCTRCCYIELRAIHRGKIKHNNVLHWLMDYGSFHGQVDSWEGLQSFLQDFASQHVGPVARSAMHFALTRSTGVFWGADREMMCHATGIPPFASGLPQEVEVFLEQAVVVVSVP